MVSFLSSTLLFADHFSRLPAWKTPEGSRVRLRPYSTANFGLHHYLCDLDCLRRSFGVESIELVRIALSRHLYLVARPETQDPSLYSPLSENKPTFRWKYSDVSK